MPGALPSASAPKWAGAQAFTTQLLPNPFSLLGETSTAKPNSDFLKNQVCTEHKGGCTSVPCLFRKKVQGLSKNFSKRVLSWSCWISLLSNQPVKSVLPHRIASLKRKLTSA